MLAINVEKKICYSRLGDDLDVSSNVIDVHRALELKIRESVLRGMDREEVMRNLNEIATAKTLEESRSTLSGGIVEYINLQLCLFPQNGMDFPVFYSSDGVVEKVEPFIYGY